MELKAINDKQRVLVAMPLCCESFDRPKNCPTYGVFSRRCRGGRRVDGMIGKSGMGSASPNSNGSASVLRPLKSDRKLFNLRMSSAVNSQYSAQLIIGDETVSCSGGRLAVVLSRVGHRHPLVSDGQNLPVRRLPSPPFWEEREGTTPQAWEGEVGAGKRRGFPHLTPTLSAPGGREGGCVAVFSAIADRQEMCAWIHRGELACQ